MTTLKASVMANGQVISNNDPLMVITLDPHPGVQISSIQDDSITYEFTGEVTEEALYNLNLTFTYNNTHRVKVPCTFKQKVINIDYTVTPKQINTKMWGHGTDLPFTVMVGGEDITSRLVDVTLVPNEWLKSYADVGGSATEWYMTGIQVNTVDTIVNGTFRFKLPVEIDPAGIVREHTGEFRVAPYDGRETTVTHEIETLMVPLSDRTPINYLFTVSYRGMPNSNNQVGLLSNSTYFGCTPGVTTKVGSEQLAISFDGGKVKGEGTTTLYFGKTGEAVSKMAIVPLNTKVYRAGVDVLASPDRITGKTGTEHESTVQVEVDGLAAKNSDLTFTNVAGDLQFVRATDTAVVWKILKTNTGTTDVDFATGVNVTKSGKTGASYSQNVTLQPSQLNVEWVTTAGDLVGAATNHITLKITDEKGEPAVGVVRKTLNMESVPKNRPDILAGYSNTLTALPEAGSYQLSANLGHLNASIIIDLVLTYDGLDFTIPTKTFATPGTPVKVTIDKTKLLTTDPANTCSLTFKQDKWLAPDADVTGKMNTFAVTGGGTSGSTAPMDITGGKLNINLAPNGKLEDIVINGTVTESDGSSSRPFTVNVTIEQDKLTLSTLGSTVLTPLKANNQPQFQVKTSKGVALSSVTSSKFTLVSDPAAGIVLANKPNIANVAGRSVDYYVDIDVGHMPGDVNFGGTFTYKGLEYVIETPIQFTSVGVPMTSVAVPATINAGENVQVEVTFKQLRTTASVLTTVDGTLELQQSGPGMTIVSQFAAKPGSPGTFVGTVSGATPGTQGQLKFTLVEQYDGFTKRWVDVLTDFTVDVPLEHPFVVNVTDNPFVGKFGETKNLGVTVTQNNNAVALNDPTLHFSFEPQGYLELISVQPTALVVKFIKDPSVEALPSQMKLSVTDSTDFGEGFFDMVTQTAKVKPTMEVTRRVTGKLYEKGPLPIMVTVGDMDYFYSATNWVTKTPGKYVGVDMNGEWTVTGAELQPTTDSIQVGFTVTHDGVAWAYLATVEFDIEPSAASGPFDVQGHPDYVVGAIAEESTITVYPTLLGQAIPENVDVAFSGTGASNIEFVKVGTSPSGRGLDITYRGLTGVNNAPLIITYKVKGLPGETEGTDKFTTSEIPLYVFEQDAINAIPASINPTSVIGPDRSEHRIYMKLYRGGQPYPLTDPRNMVYASTGAIPNLMDSEWLNIRLSGEIGKRTISIQIYDRTNTANRAMFDIETEIIAGTAVNKAIWYPIPADDLEPNTLMTLRGPTYSWGGSGLGSYVSTSRSAVNTPEEGNACVNVISGPDYKNGAGETQLVTGHTGDSFVVKSSMLLAGTIEYQQESRTITVKQAPWTLTPIGSGGWNIDASVKGKVTYIAFRATQERVEGTHTLDQATFTRMRITGPAVNVTAPKRISEGVWAVSITSDGTLGDIGVTGQLIEDGIIYPISFWAHATNGTDKLEMTNVPATINVRNGADYTIPVTLKFNDVALPFNTEGIKVLLNRSNIDIVSYDASGLKVNFHSPMYSEFIDYELNVTVMYKGRTLSFSVDVYETLTGKTKPTLTITGPVTARVGDTGVLPIVIKDGELDITDRAYEFRTIGGDDYLELGDDGKWKIIKEDATQITLKQPFYINVWYNDVMWSYSPELTFNIGPETPSPQLTNASVELKMDLWESKVIPYTVMLGETDITSSVTSIVVNNPETLSDLFEFVDTANAWAFKSIKSETDVTLGTVTNVSVIGSHEGVDYNLPMTVALKTNPNPGTIETQRFKVEAV